MTIHENLQHILDQRDDVAMLFYETLFARHPELKPYFKDVNLKHLAAQLTMALMVVERHHSHGDPSTALYLKYLGHKHHLRQIPETVYSLWIDCLLETFAQVQGPQWNPDLAKEWRTAFERAVEAMLVGYREPVHV